MKKSFKIAGILLTTYTFAFFAPSAFARKALELSYPKIPGLPDITQDTQLPDLINYIFGLFVALSGIIAFAALVYAGFLFLTSGANPTLRLEARKRLTQVFTGLLLLLGVFIVLNTVNPDLTRLSQPGVAPKIPSVVTPLEEPAPLFEPDIFMGDKLSGGLRYGGVVLYEKNPASSGNAFTDGKRETVFHNIPNFQNSTWMGNTPVAAINILGDCEVILTTMGVKGKSLTNGFTALPDLPIDSIEFVNQGCLGHSVMLYEHVDYNKDKRGVSMVLIDSVSNFLTRRPFAGGALSFNDFASSFITTLPTGNIFDLKFNLCENKDYEAPCTTLLNSTNIPNTGNNPSFTVSAIQRDWISSLQFSTAKHRQAGVVMFGGKNFTQRSEILISSDPDVSSDKSGNVIAQTSLGHRKNLDSLLILGKYRVILYDEPFFPSTLGKSIIINNAIDTPCITSTNIVPTVSGGESQIIERRIPNTLFRGNRLYIPDLDREDLFCREYENNNPAGRCTKTWGDAVASVEIQILNDVKIDQNIFPQATTPQIRECGTGTDTTTEDFRYQRL